MAFEEGGEKDDTTHPSGVCVLFLSGEGCTLPDYSTREIEHPLIPCCGRRD